MLAAATFIGAAAIQWLLPWARAGVAEAVSHGTLAKVTLCKATLVVFALLGLPVGAFGVYAFRFGRRVEHEERFPPAGVAVVRDTRVLHGRAARLLGRAQAINGALLVVLAGALIMLCAYGFLALTLHR